MPRRLPSVAGADLLWLLEIDFAGQTFRFSTEPLTISKTNGTQVSYLGGFDDPGYEESLDRFNHSIDQQVISLELVFPVDVPALFQKGHFLGGARAELSCVLSQGGTIQQTYEGRLVVLNGNVTDPQYGFPEMPNGYISASIEGSLAEDSGVLISASQSISVDTFSAVATDGKNVHEGKPYPIVFGTPGVYTNSEGTTKITSGSPAYIADVDTGNDKVTKLVIAGHHVNAATVTIFDSDESESFSVTNTEDDLGQPIATVDPSGASTINPKEREFWVGWNNGGGMKNPWRSEAELSGAGDVIRWALTKSTMSIDAGAFAAVSDYLNQFGLAGYISDPEASVWEWVSDLAIILPATIRKGADGLYPIIHDVRASASSGFQVTAGPEFQQSSQVQIEGSLSGLHNSIRLGYAFNAADSSPKRYAVTGVKETGDASSFSTVTTRQSISRYGQRFRSIESAYVYDRVTAQHVVRYLTDLEALPSRTISYRASPRHAFLSLGDVVSLTDPALYFTSQVCIVSGKVWDGDSWIFTLLIDTIPDRDIRHY